MRDRHACLAGRGGTAGSTRRGVDGEEGSERGRRSVDTHVAYRCIRKRGWYWERQRAVDDQSQQGHDSAQGMSRAIAHTSWFSHTTQSVDYIRYLQQLVLAQASRGRDLEERNRGLESELAALRGEVDPSSSASSASSCSPSVASSTVLSMPSTSTSVCSKPSMADLSGTAARCGEDLEMEDASVVSDAGERSRERGGGGAGELRGRRPGRARDKMQTYRLGDDGMVI